METLYRLFCLIKIRVFSVFRAVELLIAALKNNGWRVRQSAAEALGKIGDARAVEPLIAALKDSGGVRQSAAEALGKIGDGRAVEPLIAALKDSDLDVSKAAAEALDKFAWKPPENATGVTYWIAKHEWNRCVEVGALAVEPLIAALKERDWRVRRSAAEALGKIGDTRAVEPLIAALKESDLDVRTAAAEALGKIGDGRAVEPLIAALKDSNPNVRTAAAEALGNGDGRAVEPLIAALKDSEGHDSSKRAAAATALKRIYEYGRLGKNEKRAIMSLNGYMVKAHEDKSGFGHSDDPDGAYCASGGSGHADFHDRHSDSPEIRFHL